MSGASPQVQLNHSTALAVCPIVFGAVCCLLLMHPKSRKQLMFLETRVMCSGSLVAVLVQQPTELQYRSSCYDAG